MPSAEVSALRTQNASFCWAKRDFVSCVCHPNCQLFAVGWLWSYVVRQSSVTVNEKWVAEDFDQTTVFMGGHSPFGKFMARFTKMDLVHQWITENNLFDVAVFNIDSPELFLDLVSRIPPEFTHVGFNPVKGGMSEGPIMPRKALADELRRGIAKSAN
jgi:hypothetical protein